MAANAQGRIVFEGTVASQVLRGHRWVRVYLPPSYDRAGKHRFPVLYLHDGQNVFTTAGDHVAFGWGNWQLDRTVDKLSATGRMQEIIMVAIDCSDARYPEYRGPAYGTGSSSRNRLRASLAKNAAFERYVRFLIEELKPKIDRDYRTMPGPKRTGTLGSSMGGLCSLALGWEHANVFGKVASLSGAFQVERQEFLRGLRLYRGKTKPLRIYLDSGVIDDSGGDDGRKHTDAVARELRRIGWRDGIDLLHHTEEHPLQESDLEQAGLPRHKWQEAKTSQHNEFYWRIRAWRALTFLFPPTS